MWTDRHQCPYVQEEVHALSNCKYGKSCGLKAQFEYLFDTCANVSCPIASLQRFVDQRDVVEVAKVTKRLMLEVPNNRLTQKFDF